MAVKIICNYSKRLGLPGYSSHQFSVSVESELSNTADIQEEAARFYHTLQNSVDKEIQQTGFVPGEHYGVLEQSESAPPPPRHLTNGKPPQHTGRLVAGPVPWKASDKQRDLILKLVEDNHLELGTVEELSMEMFGTDQLPSLNKIQASGLIDELLLRYGKRTRRENQPAARFNGRNTR